MYVAERSYIFFTKTERNNFRSALPSPTSLLLFLRWPSRYWRQYIRSLLYQTVSEEFKLWWNTSTQVHRQPSRSLASGTSVSQCESTSLPWFLQHLINHHHQDDQFFITIFIMTIRCDFWNSMDVHASTVSTLHLCCISLDRWLLLFPLLHSCSIRTTKNWNHLRLLHECLQVLRHRSAVAVSHGDHTQGIPQEDHGHHHHLTPFS